MVQRMFSWGKFSPMVQLCLLLLSVAASSSKVPLVSQKIYNDYLVRMPYLPNYGIRNLVSDYLNIITSNPTNITDANKGTNVIIQWSNNFTYASEESRKVKIILRRESILARDSVIPGSNNGAEIVIADKTTDTGKFNWVVDMILEVRDCSEEAKVLALQLPDTNSSRFPPPPPPIPLCLSLRSSHFLARR